MFKFSIKIREHAQHYTNVKAATRERVRERRDKRGKRGARQERERYRKGEMKRE
jgi:hypothetical protein